jgi:hypothetical protein
VTLPARGVRGEDTELSFLFSGDLRSLDLSIIFLKSDGDLPDGDLFLRSAPGDVGDRTSDFLGRAVEVD